uniref:Uncharacterized protein n=1 Tax=Rhizophora mucronata TaxID=61149 RepID=A0A2P2QGC3_RHIMU
MELDHRTNSQIHARSLSALLLFSS